MNAQEFKKQMSTLTPRALAVAKKIIEQEESKYVKKGRDVNCDLQSLKMDRS